VPEPGIAISEVPAPPDEVFGLVRQDDPFSTLAWYRATGAYAVPADASAAFFVARQAGQVVAVLPMMRGPGRRIASLASPYASLWQPLFSPQVARDAASVRRIGRAAGAAFKASPVLRMEALDAGAFYLPPLAEGLRDAGFHALQFLHFGNWHQALPETWAAYLAGRPAALRATIRRRGKRLLGDLGGRISVIDGVMGLEQGIADYEAIYAASWKQAEPFRHFMGAYMRQAAQGGGLRLFLLHVSGTPLAAQVWILRGGCGHLLKLAHLETARALSPGTVLTAHAIEYMMERDRIAAIDFGRGDDGYKKMWAGERRQRVGHLFANPRTLVGAAAIARHVAGVVKKALLF
jgi:CelD/BcsL family acetyltransferase involved in cellulose biosynthesis